MAERIPGPDPPAITVTDVRDRLVMGWAADRRLKGLDGQPTQAHSSTDWPHLFIPDNRLGGLVTLWAWCEANGEPFRPLAERRGWKDATARRAVLRGLEIIADGLNRDVARRRGENS